MPDAAHDGSPGPSVKKKHIENQLVLHHENQTQLILHQSPLRMSYAQVACTGPPAKEPKPKGPLVFKYGVAKPPAYLRIAPEEKAVGVRHEEPDQHRGFHQELESSIIDEDYGKARDDLRVTIQQYQSNLVFAPQGTLFPQTCAVSLNHHHVYGDNNGDGYPYQIVVGGKLIGCLFCMPSIFQPELLTWVSDNYARLPRPPEPRPIGYEVKQLQAKRELGQQVRQVAEQRVNEFIEQSNKQAVDSNSDKGKQRQISASDLPYSMRHGLPPSVTQNLEPYRPVTPYQYSRLALMAQEMEQPEVASHGGSVQTHGGPAQTQDGPEQTQRDLPKPLLPLPHHSKDEIRGQSNDVQGAPVQPCGMATQDTRDQKEPVEDKPQAPCPSSNLNPDNPEFVPRTHKLLKPTIWCPQITFDETDPRQQAIRYAFENPVPRKTHQFIAAQKSDTNEHNSLLLSKEDKPVLHVPVPRSHIAARRVQHFEADLEGFTLPRLQLPYGMEPPPLEVPERAALDARNQLSSLENTHMLNAAMHGVPFLLQKDEAFNQDPSSVQIPYKLQSIFDEYRHTLGQNSFFTQQDGQQNPIAMQEGLNSQEVFSGQQPASAGQTMNAQQSRVVPEHQLPKQTAPAPVSSHHNDLWLPHEHLDEIAALQNQKTRMLASGLEEGIYNQLENGPPGRFPLSYVRSTAQNPNPRDPELHNRDESTSSSKNTCVSGSSEGSIAPWDHPGNTTSLSIFERRSVSHGTRKGNTGKHHPRRKQYRPHRFNGSSGNHRATNVQVSHGYEQLQQQFATRQCQIQSLQTQLAKLQQQQERAERRFFEQQQLISQHNNGSWANLTTGQLVFIVKPPQISQAQSDQVHHNQGHQNQATVSQELGQAQTEDENDISRL